MMKGNPGARNCYDVVRRFGHRYRIVILLMFSFAVVNYFFNTNYEQFPNSSNLRSPAASVVVANQQQCTFYLAESSIPHGGLGVFTSKPLRKGSAAQPWPDICVYLTDANSNKGTEIDSHTWQEYRFGANWLGGRTGVRATCMGLVTIFNSMGMKKYASARPAAEPLLIHTNGGLDRSKDPGAGAITQYYGSTSETLRDLVAGSELMLWDDGHGGSEYKNEKGNEEHLNIEAVPPPLRTPDWLQKHGMCLDNIIVKTSNDPSMGRGAFANRFLPKGTAVAPVPLQIYPKRSKFSVPMSQDKRKEYENSHSMKFETEQLFVNYCFQPKDSTLLLFPYGAGVGLINHSSDRSKVNVILQWSENHMNHSPQWLDPTLTLDQFWKMQYPGSLILDVVAIRNIAEGDEIFMNYGKRWENAWKDHVEKWKADISDTQNYVYPWDEMRNHGIVDIMNKQHKQKDLQQEHKSIKPFRTLVEQKSNPFPHNLMTVCDTRNVGNNRDDREKWHPSEHWPESLTECHVLSRRFNTEDATYLYEVVLWPNEPDDDDGKPRKYIDFDVPHEAIRFVDKPFLSDQHLKKAFRHPIGFPDELTPHFWKNKVS